METSTLLTILVLAIFLAGTASMISRALPALLALPLMAGALALAALVEPGVDFRQDVLGGVLTGGALRLHEAMIVAMLGGVLSHVMQSSGVAMSLVKHGAELAGDGPLAVCVSVMTLVALLFTSVGGLGALIMIAMIVLPVLGTVGVRPAVAGGLLLFGMSLGGLLNAGNWVLYVNVLELPVDEIRRFAISLAGLVFVAGVVFAAWQLQRDGVLPKKRSALVWIGASVLVAALLIVWQNTGLASPGASDASEGEEAGLGLLQFALLGLAAVATGMAIFKARGRLQETDGPAPGVEWTAFGIPIVPLFAILFFDVPIVAAFLIGLIYAVLTTLRPGWRNHLVRSLIEGSAAVMPAVLLMIGIGMLVSAILGPPGGMHLELRERWPILDAMDPLVRRLDVGSPLAFVLVFGAAAPLALYRGPLNVWGLGYGLAALLQATGRLPAAAIMAMMLTVGQVQGICDPTNTVNVWLANELGVDVLTLTKRTLGFVWALVFVGLMLAAGIYL